MRATRTMNRSWANRTVGAILAALLFLISANGHAAENIRIKLKSTVEVGQEAVRLKDLAELSGDRDQMKTLGNTVVARSPQPGQTRFVGGDYIRIRLRQAGFDTTRIVFQGAPDVRITRKFASLPVQKIRNAVASTIRNRMPWNEANVSISGIRFDETVQLPMGKLTYRITPKRNEDYLGPMSLALHLFVDGEAARKLWVNATISVMTDVVVAVRPLGKHQHIRMEDMTIERRDLATVGSEPITRPEDVLGNRTTRMIYPHTVIQADMIALPPLVKRGDIVKIVADAGPMTITATGLVKQQGRKGDVVRVMNTDSKRVILARITGPGAVKVDF